MVSANLVGGYPLLGAARFLSTFESFIWVVELSAYCAITFPPLPNNKMPKTAAGRNIELFSLFFPVFG